VPWGRVPDPGLWPPGNVSYKSEDNWRVKLEVAYCRNGFDETEAGLGFQLGAGIGYALTEALTLSLDYRVFVAFVSPAADPGQPGIGGEEFNTEYTDSRFRLGLCYRF